MFARFGPETRRVIELAEDHARDLSRAAVGPEHLLLALLASGGGDAFERAGLRFDDVHARLLEASAGESRPDPMAQRIRHLPLRLRSVFLDAFREASSLGSPQVTPLHLALALMAHPPGEVVILLRESGVKSEEIRDAVLAEILGGRTGAEPAEPAEPDDTVVQLPRPGPPEAPVDQRRVSAAP